jgi:hypothetical protein
MEEFTGQLIGGPDDGNFVSASTEKITVVSTTELWLDGEGADKSVSIVVTKGEYQWQATSSIFVWKLIESSVFSKKMEPA